MIITKMREMMLLETLDTDSMVSGSTVGWWSNLFASVNFFDVMEKQRVVS
jgi:hypothetical protein